MLVKRAAKLELLTDVDALWHGTVDALATSGFDHAIYLTVDSAFENPFLRCTLKSLYETTSPQDDPFLRYACDSYQLLPIGSEFVDRHPYLTAEERDFVERAGGEGITAALGIPMRLQGMNRFGGFIVGTGLDRATFMTKIMPRAEEVRLFCLLIHRRFEELTQQTNGTVQTEFHKPLLAPALPPKFDALSPREREVLYLLAQGRSRQEAAGICGISIHTVSDYAKSGYRKLDVNNRAQLAALLHGAPAPLDE